MNDGYMTVLSNISSADPTPGGGTVAALTLAHAQSLALMVSRLTVGKEKWQEGHIISSKIINSESVFLERSIYLANADSIADKVMESYRMPKNNDKEIETRKNAILKSTIGAQKLLLKLLKKVIILLLLPELAKFGNLNAITDLAASAELAYSAIYIASLNVKINVDSMDDSELDEIKQYYKNNF